MQKPVRVGNAQGFWGDSSLAPLKLAQQQLDLDYLTLDYLAEVSLSIMAIQREKHPEAGYARDFIDVIQSLIPHWQQGSPLKIITNAGGLNPIGCAKACQELLKKHLKRPLRIGVVYGDDLYTILKTSTNNPLFSNLDTRAPLESISSELISANVYLGAKPIVEALQLGADIVITGRVADPSLTVAPAAYHHQWRWNEYDKLAGATIAGHLIECGTQVTGGISTHWLEISDPSHFGFPFVEIFEDGSCVISKPKYSSGEVSIRTVKEQLLYEIGDPERYLSPDVTVSFLSLQLKEVGEDQVLVSDAKGSPPPSTLKVSATYRDGFRTEGLLTLFGHDVAAKAKRCGEVLLRRMYEAGCEPTRSNIECIGVDAVVPGVIGSIAPVRECMLRVAVADPSQEKLEFFARELASLVTSGPQGITGYISGRPIIRPVFGYWPCLIEATEVEPKVILLEAS